MRLPAICDACARRGSASSADEDAPPSCTAFPDGIPLAIWENDFDHRQPFPGDNGVKFLLDPDERDTLHMWEDK